MKKTSLVRNAVLAGLCMITVFWGSYIWMLRGIETLPKVSVVEADMKSIESALQMYRLISREFPTEEQGLTALVERPKSLNPDARWIQVVHKVWSDPWGDPYVYEREENGSVFKVRVYSRHSDLSDPKQVLVMRQEADHERD